MQGIALDRQRDNPVAARTYGILPVTVIYMQLYLPRDKEFTTSPKNVLT